MAPCGSRYKSPAVQSVRIAASVSVLYIIIIIIINSTAQTDVWISTAHAYEFNKGKSADIRPCRNIFRGSSRIENAFIKFTDVFLVYIIVCRIHSAYGRVYCVIDELFRHHSAEIQIKINILFWKIIPKYFPYSIITASTFMNSSYRYVRRDF